VKRTLTLPRIPTATYRLQLHHGFRFVAAQALVPYLADLGISDIYASPFFKARRKSMHGYSVTNPLIINPELGSRASFNALARSLKSRGMGLLLDIVPNHMALSHDNPWWLEVLEDGQASPYAMFFDINWHPPHRILDGKVLQPILGAPYGQILEGQELRLTLGEEGFSVHYYEHKFPLDPKTYALILNHRLDSLIKELGEEDPAILTLRGLLTLIEHLPPRTAGSRKRLQERQRQKEILKKNLWLRYQGNPAIKKFIDENLVIFNGTKGDPDSFDLLDRVLRMQPYRLASFRVALDLINYRRFFSVNDLIGLRVEDPQVFEASHGLLFTLIKDGRITGLRIDHIDGLYDPGGYLRRLQDQLAEVKGAPAGGEQEFYVVVEKILAEEESLPQEWPVAGTTGYDFLDRVNGLFVDPQGFKQIKQIYARFTHARETLPEMMYDKKKEVMESLFGGEVEALGHRLAVLAEQDRQARDISKNDLQATLKEVIAGLPCYRTYIHTFEVSLQDQAFLEQGLSVARRFEPPLNPLALDFVRRVLFLDFPPHLPEDQKKEWLDFVMRWQQFTGPVMAKGMEDTALYVYNPLVSLNEVGGSLLAFSPEQLHHYNQERLLAWPHGLNATSTHDTKRSEDVRTRIHVLSEIPDAWNACLKRWSAMNESRKRLIDGLAVPDRNQEYLLYQTLIGAWPLFDGERADFRERIKAYVIKAAREAKVHTRWISPNHEHEVALTGFVEAILDETGDNDFFKDFQEFQAGTEYYGALNSLSQVLLKIASPGVPDFYQGMELWDLSLVDPDNRREVDFEKRARLLQDLKTKEARNPESLLQELLRTWKNGALKLYITYRALNFRQAQAPLFLQGDYIPLEAKGAHGKHVVAFARRLEDSWAVVAVPRLVTGILPAGEHSFAPKVWEKHVLSLPREAPVDWVNLFTGEKITSPLRQRSRSLPLDRLLVNFPVALLQGRVAD
jgi:(1->4)-alpha-D-glucan 1-alpha-D-glucosylmutase